MLGYSLRVPPWYLSKHSFLKLLRLNNFGCRVTRHLKKKTKSLTWECLKSRELRSSPSTQLFSIQSNPGLLAPLPHRMLSIYDSAYATNSSSRLVLFCLRIFLSKILFGRCLTGEQISSPQMKSLPSSSKVAQSVVPPCYP